MARKKEDVKVITEGPKGPVLSDFEREAVMLGHFIKYNLYLLAKTIVFNSLYSNDKSPVDVALMTNAVMDELDLDTKRRKDQVVQEKK